MILAKIDLRENIKTCLKMAVLTLAVWVCILINALPAGAAEAFELHLLDVGQGQCVLVEADGRYMLIDGGGRASSSLVVSYLQQLGIASLDYLAVSHYDEDHMSGEIGVLHVFPVSQILLPSYSGEGELYQSFAIAALSSGADISHPGIGETFQLGGATIQVVGPVRSDYELENDRSLAFRVSYGETSCLICGDSEQQSETEMADYVASGGIELASDVYVVNHHGSASSSSDYFLDTVSPSYALISCGSDNTYGHPAADTLQRLQARGISMFRTDKQGTIILASDGNTYWFNQDPCQDWTPGTYLPSDTSNLTPEEIASRSLEASQDTGGTSDNTTATDTVGTAGSAASGTDGAADTAGTATSGADGAADTTGGDTTGEYSYVCNTNTRKFHYPSCNSVSQMSENNRMYTNLSRDELIAQGYEPCGNCHP